MSRSPSGPTRPPPLLAAYPDLPRSELQTLVRHLAALFDIAPDATDLGDRLIDRVGNLCHQSQQRALFEQCLRRNRMLTLRNCRLQRALEEQAAGPEGAGVHPLYLIFNQCVLNAQREHPHAGAHDARDSAFWRHRGFEQADLYGAAYLYAQAMHDLRQAQAMARGPAARRRQDAINHIAMGLLHDERRPGPARRVWPPE